MLSPINNEKDDKFILLIKLFCFHYFSDASSDVINTAGLSGDGQIAILVRGPSRVSSGREELLHVKGAEDNSISLFYNSKTNKS